MDRVTPIRGLWGLSRATVLKAQKRLMELRVPLTGWLGYILDWLAANRALVGLVLGSILVVGIIYLLLFPVREWMSNTAPESSQARWSDAGVALIVLFALLGIVIDAIK